MSYFTVVVRLSLRSRRTRWLSLKPTAKFTLLYWECCKPCLRCSWYQAMQLCWFHNQHNQSEYRTAAHFSPVYEAWLERSAVGVFASFSFICLQQKQITWRETSMQQDILSWGRGGPWKGVHNYFQSFPSAQSFPICVIPVPGRTSSVGTKTTKACFFVRYGNKPDESLNFKTCFLQHINIYKKWRHHATSSLGKTCLQVSHVSGVHCSVLWTQYLKLLVNPLLKQTIQFHNTC